MHFTITRRSIKANPPSGRPSASHYFVGTQANSFFYLDPHSTRPLLPYHSLACTGELTPDSNDARKSDSPTPYSKDALKSDSPLEASSLTTDSQTTIVPSPASAPYTPDDIATCHTRRIRRLQIREMDPSMLLAFLVSSEHDYHDWKQGVQSVQGKAVVHVQDCEPSPRGQEREGAVDEVESWDEDGLS